MYLLAQLLTLVLVCAFNGYAAHSIYAQSRLLKQAGLVVLCFALLTGIAKGAKWAFSAQTLPWLPAVHGLSVLLLLLMAIASWFPRVFARRYQTEMSLHPSFFSRFMQLQRDFFRYMVPLLLTVVQGLTIFK